MIVKIGIGLEVDVSSVAGINFIRDRLNFRESLLSQNIVDCIMWPNEPITRELL